MRKISVSVASFALAVTAFFASGQTGRGVISASLQSVVPSANAQSALAQDNVLQSSVQIRMVPVHTVSKPLQNDMLSHTPFDPAFESNMLPRTAPPEKNLSPHPQVNYKLRPCEIEGPTDCRVIYESGIVIHAYDPYYADYLVRVNTPKEILPGSVLATNNKKDVVPFTKTPERYHLELTESFLDYPTSAYVRMTEYRSVSDAEKSKIAKAALGVAKGLIASSAQNTCAKPDLTDANAKPVECNRLQALLHLDRAFNGFAEWTVPTDKQGVRKKEAWTKNTVPGLIAAFVRKNPNGAVAIQAQLSKMQSLIDGQQDIDMQMESYNTAAQILRVKISTAEGPRLPIKTQEKQNVIDRAPERLQR